MLKVAVTGASGYMGAELLRLLSVHPKVQISAVTFSPLLPVFESTVALPISA